MYAICRTRCDETSIPNVPIPVANDPDIAPANALNGHSLGAFVIRAFIDATANRPRSTTERGNSYSSDHSAYRCCGCAYCALARHAIAIVAASRQRHDCGRDAHGVSTLNLH
jgi:hypothetical protein